jgi:hypothetical protein
MTAKEVQDIVIDKYQQEHGAENMGKLLNKLKGNFGSGVQLITGEL